MIDPISFLNQWLSAEKKSGAPNPQHAVLATSTIDGVPRCRVVAIHEITGSGLLFFTQKLSKKVAELNARSEAAMTFWFELHNREVVIEGVIEPLSSFENLQHWESKSREYQVKFYCYADICSQSLDPSVLSDKKRKIEQEYPNKLPMNPNYLGFRLVPLHMIFHTSRADALSDVLEFQYKEGKWLGLQ